MEETKKNNYGKELKLQVIRMVKDDQRKVSEVSKDLGIAARDIYKWIQKYESNPEYFLPGEGKPTEKDELRRLKRKLNAISEENAILKKALAIFSKQPRSNSK